MESCNRTESSDRIWPYLVAAAAGTLLLAFVPSDAWLNGAAQTGTALLTVFLKQFLTVLLLCAVPPVWARLAHRISPWALLGLAVFAFGAGLLVTGDLQEALYTAALCALPGAGLYGLQKLKLSNFRTVIYGSFVTLAAVFVFVCVKDLIRTGDAYATYKATVDVYGQTLRKLVLSEDAQYGALLAEEADAMIDMFRSNAESYCVSGMLLASMTASLFNTLLSHLFCKNDAVLTPLPRFSEWRCERWYVLLSAGILLVALFLSMARVQAAEALSNIAGVLWRMPCMLGGLSTTRRIGIRAGKKWFFWVTVGLLVVMPPIMGMMLSLLGLLSALRKPTNVGEDGKQI